MLLASKQDVLELLKKRGIRLTKRLGQHFLINPAMIDTIVKASGLKKNDVIVETGAGHGVLTLALAPHVKKVIAIEKDSRMIPLLSETTAEFSNIEIVHNDALEYDPPNKPYKWIANIPYAITSDLILHFLMAKNRPSLAVLMVQKEVAKKICEGGEHGFPTMFSLTIHVFGKPSVVRIVPRSNFFPAPEVDSAILKIELFEEPAVQEDLSHFFKIVKTAFGQKRKQLQRSLAKIGFTKLSFIKAEIDPARRPETLSLAEWQRLLSKFCVPKA